MSNGFVVAAEQVRSHARNIEMLGDRFGAVQSASAHITANEAAYGTLCGWMARVLEGRHVRQNELFGYVQENLTMVAQRLRDTAALYENADNWAAERLNMMADELW